MSWRDIVFGLANELLDPLAARELAIEHIAESEHPATALIDLADASEGEPALTLVEQLAESEPPRSDAEVRDKWLYLVLAWLYEHRSEYTDPLQRVEEVYADFNYPERIATFVRYMPSADPDLGSREASEQRLLHNWAQYLADAQETYAP